MNRGSAAPFTGGRCTCTLITGSNLVGSRICCPWPAGHGLAWSACLSTLTCTMRNTIMPSTWSVICASAFEPEPAGQMSNSRMTNDERMSNDEALNQAHSSFGFRHSFVIRDSSFVIGKRGVGRIGGLVGYADPAALSRLAHALGADGQILLDQASVL